MVSRTSEELSGVGDRTEGDVTGTIKNINRDKGFGFIRDADGREYFFHRSALKNITFEELQLQQQVTFEEGEGPKGPRAEDIYA